MMRQITLFFALAVMFSSFAVESLKVKVGNASPFSRKGEIVEVDYAVIKSKLTLQKGESFVLTDDQNKQLDYQLIYAGKAQASKVIFEATVLSEASRIYTIKKGKPAKTTVKTYGRLVPERKDDFAWENNRIAYRIYGPALEASGEVSNGIDLWVKRTEAMVIDKWYKNDLSKVASYHEDHGEGLDFYKVGRTLGLGATAPYLNDSLWLGGNFISFKVLDNGPLRTTFILNYASYQVNGKQIKEKRTISLDANTNFNKIVVKFDSPVLKTMPLATGIVKRAADDSVVVDSQRYYAAYVEPENKINGTIYGAMIFLQACMDIKCSSGHVLAVNKYATGKEFTYYAGGGWSKSEFPQSADWVNYVNEFSMKIKTPLKVSIVK